MISSLGSSGANSAHLKQMLSRLDTDSSGQISKDEFVQGSPDGNSDLASKLFDSLDSSKSGAMSVNDLASAFQQMSSQMQSALIGAQEMNGRPDPSEMFSQLDADSDGNLTKDEFLAGKPDGVSDEQAARMWEKLSDGADSLSSDQFAEAMQAGPGGHARRAGPDISELFSKLDSDGDGNLTKDEFLAGAPDGVDSEMAANMWDSLSGGSDSVSSDQFAEAMKANGPPPGGMPPGGMPPGMQQTSEGDSETTDTSQQLIDQLLSAIESYKKNGWSSMASNAVSSLSVAA